MCVVWGLLIGFSSREIFRGMSREGGTFQGNTWGESYLSMHDNLFTSHRLWVYFSCVRHIWCVVWCGLLIGFISGEIFRGMSRKGSWGNPRLSMYEGSSSI